MKFAVYIALAIISAAVLTAVFVPGDRDRNETAQTAAQRVGVAY